MKGFVQMNYGPLSPNITSMLHGGDYNPEQWKHYTGIWDEDFRLMKLSHINTASIGIFSWSALEPSEGNYEFTWLDEIMDRMANNNMHAVLATPSGARPVWLSTKHPEVLRVQKNRTKNLYGARHNHCYTSPVYRKKVREINEQLALRYKDHPALSIWHISNELGGDCHCDLCQAEFRKWLKVKYNNDLTLLNNSWWTMFWSHTYTDWSQIESPSPQGESLLHGLNLDWKRFVTYQTIEFLKIEIEPLRRLTPSIPITTNFMWLFEGLDYSKFASELDIISWDAYPKWHEQTDLIDMAIQTAFNHDYFRSIKNGKPFMLMESTPSTTNWQPVSKLKRPNVHLLSSIQAVAHGSDSVQYFQWRKSRGSSEKFHGAVIDHCGHENTRVFKDVSQVGEALSKLDSVIGTGVPSEVAIIYDTENRWAIDDYQGFNNQRKSYVETVISHYKPFWEQNVPVDIISMDHELTNYKLVIAPMLYMVKPGVAERIERFVKSGGIFVTTYTSGLVDENDLCYLGGFPGPLRSVLGIWVEETDSLYPNELNSITFDPGFFGKNSTQCESFPVKDLCDLIHLESADCLARYDDDFYRGMPAVTVNSFGEGYAYYIAFRSNENFHDAFYSELIDKLALSSFKNSLFEQLPSGVSMKIRQDENNTFIFLMNFTDSEVVINRKTPLLSNSITIVDLLTLENIGQKITLETYGIKVLKFAL